MFVSLKKFAEFILRGEKTPKLEKVYELRSDMVPNLVEKLKNELEGVV
jgi:hypothetical protein